MKPRPTTHRLLAALLALAVILSLVGCRPAHPLRLGSNQWPGYEPVYLARDEGLLPADKVKLVELPSATEVIEYLRNGSLDAGMLTLDEVISLLADGVPLKVVLVMDVSDGADAVVAHPQIDSLDKLKGKRIGVELSAVGAVMLESLLQAAHLSVDDIALINLPVDEHLEAFRQGQVDVLITFEPTRSRLLAEGAVELFNSHRIPGRIVDVLALRQDALVHHHDQVSDLIDAYFAARRKMQQHPQSAYARMAPRLHTDLPTLKQMYQGMHLPDLQENHDWLNGKARLERQARQLADLMVQWKLIESAPALDGLASEAFLPQP